VTELVAYLLVGRLVIYALQKFPFQKIYLVGRLFREGGFLEQLFDCDFCLGFWVYTGLAFIFEINFLQEYFYVFILSEALTGVIASFLMHLITIGWKDKFSIIVVE
jgi:hypothetical protein